MTPERIPAPLIKFFGSYTRCDLIQSFHISFSKRGEEVCQIKLNLKDGNTLVSPFLNGQEAKTELNKFFDRLKILEAKFYGYWY